MKKELFNKGWQVEEKDSLVVDLNTSEKTLIDLPHDGIITKPRDPKAPSQLNSGFYPGGTFVYKKTFVPPTHWRNKKVMLELEGVFSNGEVAVNGNIVAFQPYGYTSFFADMTPYLKLDTENVISIVANSSMPNTDRWYVGAGIYRDVWLRTGERLYINPWSLTAIPKTAEPDCSRIAVKAEIKNELDIWENVNAIFRIVDADGKEIASKKTFVYFPNKGMGHAEHEFWLEDVSLWDQENPYLYQVVCEIEYEGRTLDTDQSTFGIRTIEVNRKKGLLLNGKEVKLAGGCIHVDNGPFGTVSTKSIEEYKVQTLKKYGFNAIRTAHNPASPALLNACDKYGMLVMEEAFDSWREGLLDNDYHVHFENWWKKDLSAMMQRDINHPSIILWSIGNEIKEVSGMTDGFNTCYEMTAFAKSIDDSRPITQGLLALAGGSLDMTQGDSTNVMTNLFGMKFDPEHDRWGEATAKFVEPLDIAGYNYLGARYENDVAEFQDRVIFGSETFGGAHFFDYWQLVKKYPTICGDFIWTAIEYIGEVGVGSTKMTERNAGSEALLMNMFSATYPEFTSGCGNLDICLFPTIRNFYRNYVLENYTKPYITVLPPCYGDMDKEPLVAPWGWAPVEHSWNYDGYEGKKTYVEIFSPADEIELLVNGKSYGRRPAGVNNRYIARFENIVYESGTIEAIAYQDKIQTDNAILETTGKPAVFKVTPNKTVLSAEEKEICFVIIEAFDEAGRFVLSAMDKVTCTVEGTGVLAALCSGNPKSEELFSGASRKLYEGKMMAYVQGTGEPGEVTLTIQAAGYQTAKCTLTFIK